MKNVLFVHIPRTGGTSICDALNLKHKKGPAMQLLHHSNDVSGFDDYYKFSFVRNPFDRIVSVYLHGKFRGRIKKQLDFIGFCQQLKDKTYYHPYMNEPLTYWTKKTGLDFIGRFENLKEDFQKVVEAIDFGECVLPWLNKSLDHEVLPTQTFYCDESKEIILDLFKEDFEEFGYEKNMYRSDKQG